MSVIKINDLNKDMNVSEQDMKQVVGGAAYIKFDGVDGEATDKDHKKWIDLVSVSMYR